MESHNFDSKTVVGRKDRICDGCHAKIDRGERHRIYEWVEDGQFARWHMHEYCAGIYEKIHWDDYLDGILPGDIREIARENGELWAKEIGQRPPKGEENAG